MQPQSRPPVAVLDYGVGNLHSATKALARAGAEVRVVTSIAGAAGAAGLVVPGVGAYGACLTGLGTAGGTEGARDWLATGKPMLGVCVGMQLLFEGSEEGPVADGIGALPGTLRKLTGDAKIPHIGWNEVTVRPDSRLFAGLPDGTRFYFVHSYAATADPKVAAATCDYAGNAEGGPARPWTAAVERDNLFGTQFHPEKSGAAGLTLLSNFVAACR